MRVVSVVEFRSTPPAVQHPVITDARPSIRSITFSTHKHSLSYRPSFIYPPLHLQKLPDMAQRDLELTRPARHQAASSPIRSATASKSSFAASPPQDLSPAGQAFQSLAISTALERLSSTHSATTQSAIYIPWLSLPAATPATRVLLPTSVLLATNFSITFCVTFSNPLFSRKKSDWHAPGVKQLMITVGGADSSCVDSRAASSRTMRTWRSFETAYLHFKSAKPL